MLSTVTFSETGTWYLAGVERLSEKLYIMSCRSLQNVLSQNIFSFSQISYATTSPILSVRKRFPNFFRLDIPDHVINPAKIAMLRQFDWKKVATINQAIEYHSMVTETLPRDTFFPCPPTINRFIPRGVVINQRKPFLMIAVLRMSFSLRFSRIP